MELFWVHLKMKIRGENDSGILKNFQMKNPRFFNRGFRYKLVSKWTEVRFTLINGTNDGVVFN